MKTHLATICPRYQQKFEGMNIEWVAKRGSIVFSPSFLDINWHGEMQQYVDSKHDSERVELLQF